METSSPRGLNRLVSFLLVTTVIAAIMTAFEVVKQLFHPDITVWESHVGTVIFAALAGASVLLVMLAKQDSLYRAVLDESREREQAASETRDALARLQASLEANRQAHRQLEMLAQTVRSVAECISITDMEDRVLFVNQAFLKTYGFEEADLMGKPIDVVRSPRTPVSVAEQILPATLSGGWTGEIWNRRKDGTDFQVHISTSIVRDPAGVPSALVGVARDVTEQKRTDEALKRGRESETIVSLAGGIAHEFNNLIQTVMASTTLAMEEVGSQHPARENLQAVMGASERAANLTSQLLAYAGRGTLVTPSNLDLNQVIRDLVSPYRPLLNEGTRLEMALSDAVLPIRADRRQMEQVLRALVTNAVEAMASRAGVIRVSTRVVDLPSVERHAWVTGDIAPGRYILIEVGDQGTGIDARTLSRIFDPFFSTKFLGRGMGLPAVLGIARAMGGAVAVDSEPGSGTRVIVACPVSA